MHFRLFALTIFAAALFQVQAAESKSNEIPLEFQEGFLWIKATVSTSGKPISLLLDSGAGVSVLNTSTAERLGLRFGRAVNVVGVNAALTGHWLDAISVSSSGVALPSKYLAVDLQTLGRSCKHPIDGLLGADFFRGRTIQIDFKNHKLRLLSESLPPRAEGSLPLEMRMCGMRVPITVNGHEHQWMRFDTGCAKDLQWVTTAEPAANCQRQLAIGLSALSIPQTETEVRIGNYIFPQVPTGLHPKPIFPGEAGLLGNGLLSRFSKITIDAKAGRLFLEKAASAD